MSYDISEEEANYIIQNYSQLYLMPQNPNINIDLLKKLNLYINDQINEEKKRFLREGGKEDLFMFNEKIMDPSIYFDLLRSNIYSLEDLKKYKNPGDLAKDSSIDIKYCIMLLNSI